MICIPVSYLNKKALLSNYHTSLLVHKRVLNISNISFVDSYYILGAGENWDYFVPETTSFGLATQLLLY